MNWLFWSVMILLVLGGVIGYFQGVIKIGMTLISVILAFVLVSIISPIISQGIIEMTPLDEAISASFVDLIMEDTEQIVSDSSDGEIVMTYPELTLYEQVDVIEDSELPDSMKEVLLTNNNSEIYSTLGVSTFVDYVGSYVACWTIKVASYLLSLLLVYFIIRTIFFSLDLIAEIPIIHGLNCGLGAVVGVIVVLICIWIGFVVILFFYQMDWSMTCIEMINDNALLNMLYQNNPIMNTLFKI